MRDGTRNIVGPQNAFICQYSHLDGGDKEQAESDGAIIAKAPELLAACRRALPWIGKIIADGTHLKCCAPNDCEALKKQLEDLIDGIEE